MSSPCPLRGWCEVDLLLQGDVKVINDFDQTWLAGTWYVKLPGTPTQVGPASG